MVFVKRGTMSVHTIVSNEREWISVLIAVNSTGSTMPSYDVFKRKRPRHEFISHVDGACM